MLVPLVQAVAAVWVPPAAVVLPSGAAAVFPLQLLLAMGPLKGGKPRVLVAKEMALRQQPQPTTS
jgi:hypothetical protein